MFYKVWGFLDLTTRLLVHKQSLYWVLGTKQGKLTAGVTGNIHRILEAELNDGSYVVPSPCGGVVTPWLGPVEYLGSSDCCESSFHESTEDGGWTRL